MGFVQLTRLADKRIRELGRYAPNVPAGPYAAFHHQTEVLTRISDILLVLRRLVAGRRRLTKLHLEECEKRPANHPPGVPYPLEVQKIMRASAHVSNYMRLDFEALYVFGAILLDQWAILTAYFTGQPDPSKMTFNRLVEKAESRECEAIAPLWSKERREMVWLDCHLRSHRNCFIVHVDRPWQKGTTHSIMGDDFRFHIPSPPGWLDGKAWEPRIREVTDRLVGRNKMLPSEIENKSAKGLLSYLFENIGDIEDKNDREAVMRVIRQCGVETSSFQVVAHGLLTFLVEATAIVIEWVRTHPEQVNLGLPARA